MRIPHSVIRFTVMPGSTALLFGGVCAAVALFAWFRGDQTTAWSWLQGAALSVPIALAARRLDEWLGRIRAR